MYRHAIAIALGGAITAVGIGAHARHVTTKVTSGPVYAVAPHTSETLAVTCPNRDGISGGGTTGQGAILTATMPQYDGTGAVVGWSITVQNPTDSSINARAVVVCSS